MKFLQVDGLNIFDKCLVKCGVDGRWRPAFYGGMEVEHTSIGDFAFVHVVGDKDVYEECIPWKGNEHLVWTDKRPEASLEAMNGD